MTKTINEIEQEYSVVIDYLTELRLYEGALRLEIYSTEKALVSGLSITTYTESDLNDMKAYLESIHRHIEATVADPAQASFVAFNLSAIAGIDETIATLRTSERVVRNSIVERLQQSDEVREIAAQPYIRQISVHPGLQRMGVETNTRSSLVDFSLFSAISKRMTPYLDASTNCRIDWNPEHGYELNVVTEEPCFPLDIAETIVSTLLPNCTENCNILIIQLGLMLSITSFISLYFGELSEEATVMERHAHAYLHNYRLSASTSSSDLRNSATPTPTGSVIDDDAADKEVAVHFSLKRSRS